MPKGNGDPPRFRPWPPCSQPSQEHGECRKAMETWRKASCNLWSIVRVRNTVNAERQWRHEGAGGRQLGFTEGQEHGECRKAMETTYSLPLCLSPSLVRNTVNAERQWRLALSECTAKGVAAVVRNTVNAERQWRQWMVLPHCPRLLEGQEHGECRKAMETCGTTPVPPACPVVRNTVNAERQWRHVYRDAGRCRHGDRSGTR